MSPVGTPRPLRIHFPAADLDRLQRQLNDARLPESDITGSLQPWEYGTDLAKLRQILEEWKRGNPSDNHRQPQGTPNQGVKAWWRGVEDQLNRHPNYLVTIEGIDVHYQHFKSPISDEEAGMPAIPLIFSHGWPGCFTEAFHFAQKLIQSRAPRFEVIVPSLPGYGLSSAPLQKGWTIQDSARVFDTLMTSVLGFKSYMAQGGDWGSLVTRFLANSPHCKIAHINFAPPQPPIWTYPILALEQFGYKSTAATSFKLLGYPAHEALGIQRTLDYLDSGSGYVEIQSTKPATIGYSLYDNPVGILSWILEKYHAWSDPRCPAFNASATDGSPHSHITDHEILVTVMIYHLTNSIHTSFLPYKESTQLFRKPDWKVYQASKSKPFGFSSFPYEIAAGPKSWLAKYPLNWQFYKMHNYGGHFAALDNPDALVQDMQQFANRHWPRS